MDTNDFEYYRKQAMEYAERAQPAVASDDGASFLASHPGRGTLRVQLSSGNGSFPVSGASVEVFRRFGDEKRVYYKKTTDNSGIAEGMTLPASFRQESLSSETAADSGTEYGVTVFQPAFAPEQTHFVNIYDGVETLLPITLVPSMTGLGPATPAKQNFA